MTSAEPPPPPLADGPPALRVTQLSVEYLFDAGPVRVLDGVSFDIAPGEAVALVGESGSGKTSLCQALLRLLPAPAVIAGGRIEVAGTDVTALSAAGLQALRGRRVALVPQSAMHALSPLRRVGAHLRDALSAHAPAAPGAPPGRRAGEIQPRIHQLLTQVGLAPAEALAFPHQLSGGMRQRVVIAMALAHDPALLILDEPTAALDTISSRELANRLEGLRTASGFALLLVTHDLPLALQRCARVGVLQGGRLVEMATPAVLRARPQHPHSLALLRAAGALTSPAPSSAGTSAPHPIKTPAATPLISVRGLCHQFRSGWGLRRPTAVAVDDVSFDVLPGEVVALVGGSGSGKSTIARILVRRLVPDGGQLWWRGQDVLRAQRRSPALAYRASVQMVFQDPFAALNPARTVAHHLERPLVRHRRARTAVQIRARVHDLLHLVGLDPAPDFARRFPHQLSGGQRQRVCVARALAVEPDLLIADEPTSMLDVSVRREILDLLRALKQQRGLAFLYITHDLAGARSLADRVLVLQAGKVVDSGPTERLLASPAHPHTRALIEAAAPP